MNREEREGRVWIPVEATSSGTEERAREMRGEEGEESMRRLRARSSASKGEPVSTLCSIALTAVKILRARTASPSTYNPHLIVSIARVIREG